MPHGPSEKELNELYQYRETMFKQFNEFQSSLGFNIDLLQKGGCILLVKVVSDFMKQISLNVEKENILIWLSYDWLFEELMEHKVDKYFFKNNNNLKGTYFKIINYIDKNKVDLLGKLYSGQSIEEILIKGLKGTP